jgi:hypothetical protein
LSAVQLQNNYLLLIFKVSFLYPQMADGPFGAYVTFSFMRSP